MPPKNNKVNYTPSVSVPINQHSYYLSFISFKAKKNDISLIKQIADSLEANQLPLLNQPTNMFLPTKEQLNEENFDERKHKDALENKRYQLSQEFVNKTRGLYENPNSSNQEKLKAIQIACTFLQEKEQKYKERSTLGDYLNSLKLSEETNHTVFADKALNKVFDESQKYWESEYLPKLMQTEKRKLQYLDKFYEKRPDLAKSKAFIDLSYQDQYFVAKYFEINNFKEFDDDPMLSILGNVAIEEKKNVLNEIRKKVALDIEVFNDMLVNVTDLLKNQEGIEFVKNYRILGKNDDNQTNLLKLLLEKLGKNDLINKSSILQEDYFQALDNNTLTQAIEDVRKEWYAKYVPLKIEKEVSYQAYKNDIHVQNNNALKEINKNLEKINIKLDKISLSLSEFISNIDGIHAKFTNPAEDCAEIYKRTGIQLESMKATTGKLSPEEEKRLLNSFKTDGIKYLDVVLINTKDQATVAMIKDLKTEIKNAEKPNVVLSRLEGYATMALMGGFLHGSASSAATSHAVNTLVNADITSGTGTMSSVAGGGLSALISPQALALVAITAGLYGITSANKVHKQFSDIYINVDL